MLRCFVVSALGVIPLRRRARNAEVATLALGWLAYFIYIAYWWADGSPPSRYLLATLPFLVVLLAAGIERLGGLRVARSVATAIAWTLAAYSLFISHVYAVVEARVGDLLLGSVRLVAALALVVLRAATAHDGSRNG